MNRSEMIKYLETQIEKANAMLDVTTSDDDYGGCGERADHLLFQEGIYRGKEETYKEMIEILKGE